MGFALWNWSSVSSSIVMSSPYHRDNSTWFPELIAITNKAKHVGHQIPTFQEMARAKHERLFFQLEDSEFSYHSFIRNAGGLINAIDSSTRLGKSIRFQKEAPNANYLFGKVGRATKFLLDQDEDSLKKISRRSNESDPWFWSQYDQSLHFQSLEEKRQCEPNIGESQSWSLQRVSKFPWVWSRNNH